MCVTVLWSHIAYKATFPSSYIYVCTSTISPHPGSDRWIENKNRNSFRSLSTDGELPPSSSSSPSQSSSQKKYTWQKQDHPEKNKNSRQRAYLLVSSTCNCAYRFTPYFPTIRPWASTSLSPRRVSTVHTYKYILVESRLYSYIKRSRIKMTCISLFFTAYRHLPFTYVAHIKPHELLFVYRPFPNPSDTYLS